MSQPPHNIRPGMTGDMGVTPDTRPAPRPDAALDAEKAEAAEPAPEGPIKDPMAIEVEPSPNPVDPHDEDKA